MGATVFYESANELATLTNTFSVSGTPTDPTAVTLTVTTPAGTATTYTYSLGEITRTSAGIYTKDIACSAGGVWQYVWNGTGAASDTIAGTWTVFGTDLHRLYCTPEELKSRTGIADDLDDFEILAACTAVSRWIDQYCTRAFYRDAGTRTFIPDCIGELDCGDLVSVTTLKTDSAGDGTFETTWAASDYQLLPHDAAVGAEPRPYTRIAAIGSQSFPLPYGYARRDRIEIAGVFGWPAVPPAVKQAAAILSNDYLKLGAMAFGVAGYGEYGAVRARQSIPAMDMLGPYRRHPILVA